MFMQRQSASATSLDCPDAPAQEPSVVHSSFGRLRVHLPHWPGTRGDHLVAGILQIPGVTHAEARPITGNVLILFDPRQTNAQILMEALPGLRLDLPVCSPLPQDTSDQLHNNYMTGMGRVAYQALGWSSVGMAVVGAILPGIPAAPFVVLAGYFFIRSSPEAHRWLRQSRWFGPLLRDWEEHRAVRRSVRNAALALIGAGMVLTALMGLPTALMGTILSLQAIGMVIVVSLRVVEPIAPAPAAG
jgi:uncharacterized protein